MRVILIDVSGGVSNHQIESVRNDIRVGDHVIFFDHRFQDHGMMNSREDIAALPLVSSCGGTILDPAFKYIRTLRGVTEIICYTDGYLSCSNEIHNMIAKGQVKIVLYPDPNGSVAPTWLSKLENADVVISVDTSASIPASALREYNEEVTSIFKDIL